jgi:hypothetical protein
MNLASQTKMATGAINRRIPIRGMFVAAAVGFLLITIVLAWTANPAAPSASGVDKAPSAALLLDPAVIEHLRREHADSAVAGGATGSQFDRSLAEHRHREYGSANDAASNPSSAELLLNPVVVEHLQRERAN